MTRALFLILGLLFVTGVALAAEDVCAPSKVIDLAVSTGRTTLVVTWTAPGDDCIEGTAAAYDLRYSTSPITEANFTYATPISTNPPQPYGSSECASLSGLPSCTTYYFALKTRDEVWFWSPLSNLPSRQTKCSPGPEKTCAD